MTRDEFMKPIKRFLPFKLHLARRVIPKNYVIPIHARVNEHMATKWKELFDAP